MKKLLLIMLLVATLLLVTACSPGGGGGGGGTGDGGTEDGGSEDGGTVTYTITWISEDGATLSVATVEQGSTPAFDYSVSDTAEWDYTFEGWATSSNGEALTSIPPAQANATYYACVSAVKRSYTVSFVTGGGSAVESQTVEYGSSVQPPIDPTYEGYRFMGWSAAEDSDVAANLSEAVVGNRTYYAIWNEQVDIKGLLSTLLDGYRCDPLAYIPESMLPNYSANLVSAEDIISDYSTFTNVSDITYGFGEQWHMVLENLQQSEIFFSTLSVIETLASTSVTVFNNYFDSNPSDTAHHTFDSGIYNVTVNFDGEEISYVVDYTAQLPVLGEQTVQIALSMNAETGDRVGRIQLGDANALVYKTAENYYEFAIKYLGIREAMLIIERNDDGTVSGHIFEHLTVSALKISSAAEFYITEDYVSTVGNKADGMTGFTGYISELYSVETGKMLGYEVKETLSSIEYNTLWFNLEDVSGINSVKYLATEDNPAQIYINGSSSLWEAKNVGGLSLKALSRRFDIELRTQYVYSYDAENEKILEHKVEVPLIFVQEENYDTFQSDVEAVNDVSISVGLTDTQLEKLLLDYDSLIPVFIENKGAKAAFRLD